MKRQPPSTAFSLTKDQKDAILGEIEAFYLDKREEEIGIIEKEQILELFMDNLAPIVYNKALDDAMKWYKHAQENLESDFYSLYKEDFM